MMNFPPEIRREVYSSLSIPELQSGLGLTSKTLHDESNDPKLLERLAKADKRSGLERARQLLGLVQPSRLGLCIRVWSAKHERVPRSPFWGPVPLDHHGAIFCRHVADGIAFHLLSQCPMMNLSEREDSLRTIRIGWGPGSLGEYGCTSSHVSFSASCSTQSSSATVAVVSDVTQYFKQRSFAAVFENYNGSYGFLHFRAVGWRAALSALVQR